MPENGGGGQGQESKALREFWKFFVETRKVALAPMRPNMEKSVFFSKLRRHGHRQH